MKISISDDYIVTLIPENPKESKLAHDFVLAAGLTREMNVVGLPPNPPKLTVELV